VSTALHPPRPFVAPIAGIRASSRAYPYTVAIAAACVMVGVYWDISWHMSIGRDSFWTPAHLLIQAGGLIAGLSSGYVALTTTFRGTPEQQNAAVSFWGFRAPLGSWICIWGCGAMLTSAPFDNWWHNAYGLDVQIISPPHTLLAIGIYSIVIGAFLLTVAHQNRAEGAEQRRLAILLAGIGGLFIMNFAIFLTEYSERMMQHGAPFYDVAALAFPFALVSISRAVKLKWPATAAAAAYMMIMLVLMWLLQLLPATPKLGPIYHHVTNMVTLAFPLWLIAPAFAIDLVRHRFEERVAFPVLAVMCGVAFIAAFVAVQWPFARFLVENPASRNWFFNAENYVYWASPGYDERSHRFAPDISLVAFLPQLWKATLLAIVSSALGLNRGKWISRVQR